MRVTLLSILLLATGAMGAFAADTAKGPYLSDLMKRPSNRGAWDGMLAGETRPPWIDAYAKTLDGPPTPAIIVKSGEQAYMLAFTCKPNACSDNQLFVLFSASGAKAWGLLLTGDQRKWLGAPDDDIQKTILSAIQ
jgi:Inhibitor of vertebrate lysozyme (Ivy)